ncbi:MAG: hypothetical protein MPJ04_08190 [Nitrosopumilus sp.]|nr:hypothetical protein [Nitrosopumilus sp.]MDA7955421.1 hypothetical protein [Nitrosopumilus sp.]MDA7997658.1 hypothetical protein [Nitrosopumilus sp.]
MDAACRLTAEWVGLEDGAAVTGRHLARIEEGIRAESERTGRAAGFAPSGGTDSRIRAYCAELADIEDAVSGAERLSGILKRDGRVGTAARIDALVSEMGTALAGLSGSMAGLLRGSGRCGEADEITRRPGVPAGAAVAICEELREAGDHDGAWDWAHRAVGADPGHLGAAYNWALLQDEAGDYYSATDKLDWLLDAARQGRKAAGLPDPDMILLRLGMAHAHWGDHESAVRCYGGVDAAGPLGRDAAYHRAESLYRIGACAEAAGWFGRAAGRLDADARREAITGMLDHTKERVLLPLLVAGTWRIRGMPHLQHAAFLAQTRLGIRAYDFALHGFGPYSEELAADVSAHTGLFRVGAGWNEDPMEPRTYDITGRGRDVLVESGWSCADAAHETGTDPGMADAVYSVFGGADPAVGAVMGPLARVVDGPYAHGWIGTEAEHAMYMISNTGPGTPPATRSAVLNIAAIIAHYCARAVDCTEPPVDHYAREDALSGLCEYGMMLMNYTKARGVAKYPDLSNGLEGILCGGTA